MITLTSLLKVIAILAAAVLIGNWYQAENRKIRASGKPWYKLYTSVPGILIVVIISLPIILWFLK